VAKQAPQAVQSAFTVTVMAGIPAA
jgi:hypothetical protein